jgi:hypothetical protein
MQAWKVEQFGPLYENQAGIEDVTSASVSAGIEKKGGVLATQEGFDRWDYRAGFSYKTLPYQLTGSSKEPTEYGLALGVSLPLAQKSGKLHLALEGGLRASGKATEESFVRFHAHVDVHERWFERVRRSVK